MVQQTIERAPKAIGLPAVKSSLRRDIQGLRAVAVLAVIADHLFKWPTGGFIGVDVFFVISGFLITGQLLKEADRTGAISFIGFYRRRVKRILPASIAVLLLTVAAAYVIFNTGRFMSVSTDAIWAFLFSANWHFATIGTDYFLATGPISPLQHFWSLAVEEQFYFVWPWLMLLIFSLVARRVDSSRAAAYRAVGFTMAAIIVVSFAWAMYETATAPTAAYFSTFSRAWELGVGALLAVSSRQLGRLPLYLRPVLAWLGVLGIVASLFVVSGSSLFPAPWAALPVFATALVIAAGTGERARFLWPLTNKVTGYVGNISYSLYLVHFPVIVFLGVFFPEGPTLYVTALLSMFALAAASYHLLEDPVRKSQWLEPKSSRRRHEREFIKGPSKAQIAGLGALAVVTAGVCAVALFFPTIVHPTSASSAALPVPKGSASPSNGAPVSPADALTADIYNATLTAEWPNLNPSIDDLGKSKAAEWDQCLSTSDDNVASCSFGDPKSTKTVAVLGDSVALSWLPGIRAGLESQGWRIQNLTMPQCPTADVQVVATNGVGGAEIPGFNDKCSEHRAWALDQVKKMQPDLVIMSNNKAALSSGATGDAAHQEWTAGYQSYLMQFKDAAKKVIIIGFPAEGKNLAECMTKFNHPDDCATTADLVLDGLTKEKTTAVAAAISAGVNASYIDPTRWLCTSSKKCPAFVGTTPVRADTIHLTDAYSTRLGPVIAQALLAPTS